LVVAVLQGLYFVGLQAFLALHNLESALLTFFQRLEPRPLDGTEVDEQVLSAFRGDEAVAFSIVKPLNGASLTIGHGVLLL
jgi:hypothetical protein